MILAEVAAGSKPGLLGGVEACPAGVADGLAAAVVLVVGGDVADAFVESDLVVVGPEPVELGFEAAGVGDLVQVGPFAVEVSEERLDPGLVVGGGGPPEVLRDPGVGVRPHMSVGV